MRSLLAVALLGLCIANIALADDVDEKDVVVLTDKNFDEKIKAAKFALVRGAVSLACLQGLDTPVDRLVPWCNRGVQGGRAPGPDLLRTASPRAPRLYTLHPIAGGVLCSMVRTLQGKGLRTSGRSEYRLPLRAGRTFATTSVCSKGAHQLAPAALRRRRP